MAAFIDGLEQLCHLYMTDINKLRSNMKSQSNQYIRNANDTIETLANGMFIESSPQFCTYAHIYRYDSLEVFTTFMGVFPGLSLSIHLIVPYLVKTIGKVRNQFRVSSVLLLYKCARIKTTTVSTTCTPSPSQKSIEYVYVTQSALYIHSFLLLLLSIDTTTRFIASQACTSASCTPLSFLLLLRFTYSRDR